MKIYDPLQDNISQIAVIDVLGTDLTVVNSARVSFNKESFQMSKGDAKLIKFLAVHGHWTPFSHPQIQLRLKMPIFVARQWFKHMIGFSRNEVSRRYVTYTPEFHVPTVFRAMNKDKKQGSLDEPVPQNSQLAPYVTTECQKMVNLYQELLTAGVCPEQARIVLPQNVYTEFYETGSLAAYMRLVGLRNKPDAQKEIRLYAQHIHNLLKDYFPITMEAIDESSD